LSCDTRLLSNHNKYFKHITLKQPEDNESIIKNLPITKENRDMKKFGARKFRGEMFCQRCAEKHLSKLKTKLTDKKLAEILADEKLKIAEKALRKAQQAVQAPKEHKNKTQIDAKKAEDDLLEFSKALEMTPFSGRIRNEYFLN
jgi:hypothetical protein